MNINQAEPNSRYLTSSKDSSSTLKRTWSFIIGSLIELFEPQFSFKTQIRNQIVIEVIKNVIMTAQVVSICWYPDMPISNWNLYTWFWNSMWIFNFANICEEFSIFIYCYYIEFSLVLYTFIIVIIWLLLKLWGHKLPLIFIFIVKKLSSCVTSLLFIPLQMILLTVFKYSTFKYEKVQEYYDNDINNFNYGNLGTILSSFIFFILIGMAFSNEILSADLRHSLSYKNIRARSNSLWDLLWISFCVMQCLLYVFLDQFFVAYYLNMVLVMGLYLFWLGMRFMHYYNPIEMSIIMSKVGSVCIIIILFIFGYVTDDAGTFIFLSIFLPPLFSAYITYFIHKKYINFQNRVCNPLNQFTLERSLRHFLIDKKCENKEEIIRIFSKYFNKKYFKNDSLLVIWEVNFITLMVKDELLARVKLAKIKNCPLSIEGYIQEKRILKSFEDKKYQKLPEINYLEYLTGLDVAKRWNEEMCIILMDLWTEIAGKNSKINKICNLAERVADLSEKIKSLYSDLANKNKYSEVFDLYGMFLINILGETQEGNVMLNRKYSIKKFSSILRDRSKQEDYGEGIILISTQPDSFGSIAYMNEKAAVILKISLADIIGTDFNNFIPKPFSTNHNEKMKEYYYSCEKTMLVKSMLLPLLDHDRFIIECNLSIKLTAFKDTAYYMVSLSKHEASRQSILIAEDGFIYNHSSQLSTIIGSNSKHLDNNHLSDLFFGFDLGNLQLFEPLIYQLNHRKIVLIHTSITFRSIEIHTILVISDNNEIEKWLKRETEEQIEYSNKVKIENNIIADFGKENFEADLSEQIDPILLSVEKAAKINAYNDENLACQAPASSISQSSTLDRKFYIERAIMFINRTNAAIVKFKWVIFFAIIAMIGANIGILIYIIDDVTHTDSLETFNHLGQLMFYVGSIADLSRSIDIELSAGKYNLTRDLEYLENDIKALNMLQSTLLDDKLMWNYCESSKIVIKDVIPIWELDAKDPIIKKYNLYDTVSLFLENEKELLKHAKTKDARYKDHIKWLMINSLSFSYQYIETALFDLVMCEKIRIEETGVKINGLLILGIVILGICLGVLVYFIFSFRIAYENFWSFIKKSVISNYILIKQTILDRLVSVHGVDLTQDSNLLQKPTNSKNFRIKTTLIWKFSWRLSFLCIVSISFYLLIMFYLYKNCEMYMINRPKLLQNINMRRSLLSRIGLYARDINYLLNKKYFSNSYSFANSSKEFSNLVDHYIAESNQLRTHDLSVLLSNELKTTLYESTNYTAEFLTYGTRAAIYTFMFDAYNIGGPGGIRPDYEISKFIADFTDLQDALADVFAMVDSSSRKVISDQLNLMIWITIVFSFCLALLYLFYYLPFINTQTDFLRKIKTLPKMIQFQVN